MIARLSAAALLLSGSIDLSLIVKATVILIAALASVARAPKESFAESSGVFTASRVFAMSEFGGSEILGDKQHGLIIYRLPKTSECFMPIRVAP